MENLIQTITIYALPVIFAITLHEAAHGYVARYFGDMTAYAQGRVTLNPLKHIDLVGTIIVPLTILLLAKMAGTGGFFDDGGEICLPRGERAGEQQQAVVVGERSREEIGGGIINAADDVFPRGGDGRCGGEEKAEESACSTAHESPAG